MIEQPLVTVNILSFNRINELRNTLKKVYEQEYKNIEVIVVDNASNDGSSEMVKKEFPGVNLIQLEKNIGIAGWNEGFKVAKGEYVLVLDDDSYPDKNSLLKGLEAIKKNKNVGIITFNIFNLRINKSETQTFNQNPRLFVGCGALISKTLLDKVGFYNEQYHIYLHELDYSSRCYNAGFDIIYLENVFIYHVQNPLSRGKKNEDPYFSGYRFKYYFINQSIFLIQRFSTKSIIKFLPKWMINRTLVCIRYLFLKEYITSIMYLIINMSSILKGREVLSYNVQKFYDFGNVPFIDNTFLKKII
jgi:GT2 family glycosyltransferase